MVPALDAELVMRIEDWECQKERTWAEGTDFTASDDKSNDKILLRIITDPKSRSGDVVVDDVKKMLERMKHDNCSKGVIISKSFSDAAMKELKEKGIKIVSETSKPYKPQELYLKLQDLMNDLCKAKCGHIPQKESDCMGHSEGTYSCKIRLIGDDASFHLARGWTKLLQNDLKRLLCIDNAAR